MPKSHDFPYLVHGSSGPCLLERCSPFVCFPFQQPSRSPWRRLRQSNRPIRAWLPNSNPRYGHLSGDHTGGLIQCHLRREMLREPVSHLRRIVIASIEESTGCSHPRTRTEHGMISKTSSKRELSVPTCRAEELDCTMELNLRKRAQSCH